MELFILVDEIFYRITGNSTTSIKFSMRGEVSKLCLLGIERHPLPQKC